ncbi:MAG: DUF3501 family protein [Actinomycetota bacterium]|jgi:hypothetical protein|nr:DUF3501 family protein [Actinomycetota bacterium]
MAARSLGLDDILDLRAYERVRDDYRRRVIELKRRRRIALGPIITVVFECLDTVRFQVQEMARAERIATDEGVQQELDVYNRLLPGDGELSATLFVELTTEHDLRHWLPRLVGVERALAFELGDPVAAVVRSVPEESHAEALTREAVTPAVHYIRFPFSLDARERFVGADPVALTVHHPEYEAHAVLGDEARAELSADLEGRTELLPLA